MKTMKTIDELVELLHPDFVSVDSGYKVPGTVHVKRFKVDYDVDGVHMYVTVDNPHEGQRKAAKKR